MMRLIKITFSLFTAFMLISCGENTDSKIIHDVKRIYINTDKNITSVYSTQSAINLSATIVYDDNTSEDVTDGVTWLSSNSNILTMTQNSALATANGGDVNISIEFKQFNDTLAFKVHKLLSINYSDINTSDTSNAQTIYVSGNFENNDTNVSMQQNMAWRSDANATISESNASQITLTLHATRSMITGTLFQNTSTAEDFNYTIGGN